MSIEPLREYFETLRMISLTPYVDIDGKSEINVNKVKALVEQGCLSGINSPALSGISFKEVSITPHGAVVLAEWSRILDEMSLKSKFMVIVERFVWVFVGIMSTVISQILIKLNP